MCTWVVVQVHVQSCFLKSSSKSRLRVVCYWCCVLWVCYWCYVSINHISLPDKHLHHSEEEEELQFMVLIDVPLWWWPHCWLHWSQTTMCGCVMKSQIYLHLQRLGWHSLSAVMCLIFCVLWRCPDLVVQCACVVALGLTLQEQSNQSEVVTLFSS